MKTPFRGGKTKQNLPKKNKCNQFTGNKQTQFPQRQPTRVGRKNQLQTSIKTNRWGAALLNSTSAKVSLKEIRWPSFSVSTSTPSQSKRSAEGREEAEQVIPWRVMRRALLLLLPLMLVRVLVVDVVKEEESFLSWKWTVETEMFAEERRAVAVEEEEAFVERRLEEEKEEDITPVEAIFAYTERKISLSVTALYLNLSYNRHKSFDKD